MDFLEFQLRVNEIANKIKEFEALSKNKREELGMPDFYPGYKMNYEEYKENMVHAYGIFPYKLLDEIAPNADDDEKRYIERTYECVTEDVFQDFTNTAKRGFANGRVERTANTEQAKELEDDYFQYIDSEIPKYDNLRLYMSSLTDQKLTDANAVVAIDYDAEVGEDGVIEGYVKPYPVMYHTDRVMFIGDNSFVVESYMKSPVVVADKEEFSGYVFIGYSKDYIYRAVQVGKKKDWTFEYYDFEHEIGYTPAVRVGGIPIIKDDELYFQSPFSKSVPNLNLAVLDSVNLLLIKRKVVFPTRVFVTQKCNYQEQGTSCHNGVLHIADGDRRYDKTCPQCKGSGVVGVFGPNAELMINADETHADSPNINANNAMAYVSPPIDTPKFLREEIDMFITRAREVLHLKAEPRKSGNITATEKNIDVKNTEAFIKPISDQIWYLYQFLLDTIGYFRYGNQFDEFRPIVIPPTEFDLLTSQDYIDQISEARKNNLPEVVISSLIYNLLRAESNSDTFAMKAFMLIESADRLLTMTNEEIALGLSRNTIQRWEAILHQSALNFILRLSNNFEPRGEFVEFFDLPMTEQVQELQNMARNAVPETSINLPPAEEI